jgi:hypothetical protein
VIGEVDESLGDLLRSRAVPGGQVEVSFEPPTRDWVAGRNIPTVNAYLYDIREDTARREYGMISVRDDSGAVTRRHRPLRHFRLSYLVTCWTRRPEDEHRLLSAVLGCLVAAETLPIGGSGPLASLGPVVQLALAPPGDSRSAAELWSALGGDLKPSLDVVVVAPYPEESGGPVAPPVTEAAVVGRRLDEPGRGDPPKHGPARPARVRR